MNSEKINNRVETASEVLEVAVEAFDTSPNFFDVIGGVVGGIFEHGGDLIGSIFD